MTTGHWPLARHFAGIVGQHGGLFFVKWNQSAVTAFLELGRSAENLFVMEKSTPPKTPVENHNISQPSIGIFWGRIMIEGNLEVKVPRIWTD